MALLEELTVLLEKAKAQDEENALLRERISGYSARLANQGHLLDLLNDLVDEVIAYRVRYPEPLPTQSVETAQPEPDSGPFVQFNAIGLAGLAALDESAPLPAEQPAKTNPTRAKPVAEPVQRRPVTENDVRTWAQEMAEGLTLYAVSQKHDRSFSVVKRALIQAGYICECLRPITAEDDGLCPSCRAKKAKHMENPAFLSVTHAPDVVPGL